MIPMSIEAWNGSKMDLDETVWCNYLSLVWIKPLTKQDHTVKPFEPKMMSASYTDSGFTARGRNHLPDGHGWYVQSLDSDVLVCGPHGI